MFSACDSDMYLYMFKHRFISCTVSEWVIFRMCVVVWFSNMYVLWIPVANVHDKWSPP